MIDGLQKKYIIQKADGSPIDPNAEYFVLRVDLNDIKDIKHREACIVALQTYSVLISKHLPHLAQDLDEKYVIPFLKKYYPQYYQTYEGIEW